MKRIVTFLLPSCSAWGCFVICLCSIAVGGIVWWGDMLAKPQNFVACSFILIIITMSMTSSLSFLRYPPTDNTPDKKTHQAFGVWSSAICTVLFFFLGLVALFGVEPCIGFLFTGIATNIIWAWFATYMIRNFR